MKHPEATDPAVVRSTPSESAVWDALRSVIDPEIGESIVDIGLVYSVSCTPECVEVEITMTTPTCPAADAIAEEARHAIHAACPEAREVAVAVVFDPPWEPSRMSDALRQRFGW